MSEEEVNDIAMSVAADRRAGRVECSHRLRQKVPRTEPRCFSHKVRCGENGRANSDNHLSAIGIERYACFTLFCLERQLDKFFRFVQQNQPELYLTRGYS
jgi:hypothetical protein